MAIVPNIIAATAPPINTIVIKAAKRQIPVSLIAFNIITFQTQL